MKIREHDRQGHKETLEKAIESGRRRGKKKLKRAEEGVSKFEILGTKREGRKIRKEKKGTNFLKIKVKTGHKRKQENPGAAG